MCCQLLSATETRWVGNVTFSHLKIFTLWCIGKLIESLDKQLEDKGAEINGYMEKHNIQLKDQQGGGKKKEESGAGDGKSGAGVLVSN